MVLLSKNGVLATFGGALARFVAACIDACCGKWYCHLPAYTCDQNEPGHISEHATRDECLRQCGDGVEHYCHGDYECDTDPTDALASYPSKRACEENCSKDYAWYCVYKSADYTRGSECQQGKGPDEGLVRSGPYDDKPACDAECESLYYCVLLNGFDGSQPEHYACVIDPTGHLVISGPTSQTLCEASCSTRRRTIWCVDNKRCVISFDGPPPECSFGVFCEEHDTYQECVQFCHPEKWYCVTPGQPCQQMANPPTPDAIAYSTQAACDDECDDYYCCWVSTDQTKGSYCQLGRCPPGFERSGPHQDKRACEGECHKISCWSYNDITTSYKTLKVCQEESPDGCEPSYGCVGSQDVDGDQASLSLMFSYRSDGFDADRTNIGGTMWRVDYRCQRQTAECDVNICAGPLRPDTCIHENVTKESGPYGKASDCEPVCNPPVYKWYCENQTCKKCCASGNCVAGDVPCPAGVTLHGSPEACSPSCDRQGCGETLPSTARVELCGFRDLNTGFTPACASGAAGYAAAFNQTVILSLQPQQPSDLYFVWKGALALPAGYDAHTLWLYRGLGTSQSPCSFATMQLTSSSCVNGSWSRNSSIPLPAFGSGWLAGATWSTSPNHLQTNSGRWANIAVENRASCRITFGSSRDGNPLP